MALTTLQEIQLFRALEVPYATSYNTMDDMGTLSASTNVSTDSSAKTQILAFITASITPTAALENELTRLIGLYADAEFKVGKIEDGSVGDLGSVTFSWDEKRESYKKAILGLIPFFRYHETLKTQQSGVVSVPFIR